MSKAGFYIILFYIPDWDECSQLVKPEKNDILALIYLLSSFYSDYYEGWVAKTEVLFSKGASVCKSNGDTSYACYILRG